MIVLNSSVDFFGVRGLDGSVKLTWYRPKRALKKRGKGKKNNIFVVRFEVPHTIYHRKRARGSGEGRGGGDGEEAPGRTERGRWAVCSESERHGSVHWDGHYGR